MIVTNIELVNHETPGISWLGVTVNSSAARNNLGFIGKWPSGIGKGKAAKELEGLNLIKATRFATCKTICKIIHTALLHIPGGFVYRLTVDCSARLENQPNDPAVAGRYASYL
jgi:hypothetical protein